MSLNNIIDDILLTLRNSNISESEHLSRMQIEKWIHHYRALLLKRELNDFKSQGFIDSSAAQWIPSSYLERVTTNYGKTYVKLSGTIPELITSIGFNGIVSVTDMYDNPILISSSLFAKLNKSRGVSSLDYIAYIKDNQLFIEGDSNQLEFVLVSVICQDPSQLEGFNPDDNYPCPVNLLSAIKQLIFLQEIISMQRAVSDDTNDGNDDTQRGAQQTKALSTNPIYRQPKYE